ncbi:hypothetical protein GCM10027275_25810 [Rhabdobacter roseus]|uniref:Lipocalin-like domain-containing protein n=1 Tax=Rhabdobacter roseus TaxID=1655419 RepID=A0A840TS45_9BACT|nr:hypothetical protein [Rhabdobacter roseus]MBB5284527.1 hypothetical protein [Rhabdobacter roseus]
MKKVLLFLVLISLLPGCKKDELMSADEISLIGKWNLTEFCVSAGAGPCETKFSTVSYAQTVQFQKDGSFIQSVPEPGKFQTPLISSGQYRLLNQSQIELQFDQASNLESRTVWTYELAGKRLTLYPLCIEGCYYTYVKTN